MPLRLTLNLLRLLLIVGILGAAVVPAFAQEETADDPVVRGVLFFSPTCPHCEAVLNDHLPGIYETFGGRPTLRYDETLPGADLSFYLMTNGRLELLLVDTSTEAGNNFFLADTRRLGSASAGVPRLDVGDQDLVGSVEIPERLPGLVEVGLAGGGIAWPPIPGLEEALRTIPSLPSAQGLTDAESGPASPRATAAAPDAAGSAAAVTGSTWDRVGRDPLGNGLAILVLVLMLASLLVVPFLASRGSLSVIPTWSVPALGLIGMGVSAYLGIVEASGSEAVCGPVGDCNTVQQSEYAALFGIPIGILGLIGYAVLLVAWVLSRVTDGRPADMASVLVSGIALGGTLFSLYLTYLEPFVIGATCAWCLASALTMTGLLWATATPGWAALRRLLGADRLLA